MAERPQRRTPQPKHATVVRSERLTPHMIRVVLTVDPAATLEIGACTDHYVHGEAGFVKELRRHLRLDRGVPRERMSVSGYWRRGSDEDGWQASKRDWNAAVEAEQEPPSA